MSGQNRSHAENKTKRKFEPNMQVASVYSEKLNQFISLRTTPSGLRTIEHNGGLDSYVMSIAKTKLSPVLRRVRKLVEARKEGK
jgi:large subunit ribosomal protein L28